MNIRRVVLDVDKAMARPSLLEIGEALSKAAGVEAFNITVTEIDVETVGMNITIEGSGIDYTNVEEIIESTGAVVHSIDELVVGTHMVESVPRAR